MAVEEPPMSRQPLHRNCRPVIHTTQPSFTASPSSFVSSYGAWDSATHHGDSSPPHVAVPRWRQMPLPNFVTRNDPASSNHLQ